MPAAAVTPAPIAYIKVVAVKKLVVGCLSSAGRPVLLNGGAGYRSAGPGLKTGTGLTVGQHRRSAGEVVGKPFAAPFDRARASIVRGAL